MPEPIAYYEPGPYYADPMDGGSDCLCEVAGDGTEERPYRIRYCLDHQGAAALVAAQAAGRYAGSFWTPLLFPLGLLAGAALQAVSMALLRAL